MQHNAQSTPEQSQVSGKSIKLSTQARGQAEAAIMVIALAVIVMIIFSLVLVRRELAAGR